MNDHFARPPFQPSRRQNPSCVRFGKTTGAAVGRAFARILTLKLIRLARFRKLWIFSSSTDVEADGVVATRAFDSVSPSPLKSARCKRVEGGKTMATYTVTESKPLWVVESNGIRFGEYRDTIHAIDAAIDLAEGFCYPAAVLRREGGETDVVWTYGIGPYPNRTGYPSGSRRATGTYHLP
jgi:hypothetical protein